MEVQADHRPVQEIPLGELRVTLISRKFPQEIKRPDHQVVMELQVPAEGTHRLSSLSLIALHTLKNGEETRLSIQKVQ